MGLWTANEVEDLSLGWGAFSERHPGRTYKAFWNKFHSGVPQKPAAPVVLKDKVGHLTDQQIDAYLESILSAAEMDQTNHGEQLEITVDIDTDCPIGMCFTGDWHLSQRGTDHRTLIRHNKLIEETPGLYVIGMGDYSHNAKVQTKPATSLYRSIIPDPDDQKMFYERELRRFTDKCPALVRGCHDDWDFLHSGHLTLPEIAKTIGAASLGHGGMVHLNVGDQTYHILVRHKYGGNSLNTTNAQRKAYDDYPVDDRADIIVIAHLHFNDMQMRTRGKTHKVVYFRSGSYYIHDEFGQKIGGFVGEIGVPMVILWPDQKKFVPFEGSNFEQAIEMLRYYRADN